MTRTIAETEYVPSHVEVVRIVNVNIVDWSVDCVSEKGGKRYFDIQVMSPYFHYMNGEGIYAVPEVGAVAWLCLPSEGRFAAPFLLGFMSPFEQDTQSFRSGRQNLNPGDIMLRTRDENFVVLRRGGVLQMGATPVAQRMFIPIRNYIKDFCENYELATFGGTLSWTTERDDQTTDGSSPTVLRISAKEKANDSGNAVELSLGSHGEDSPTTLELVVRSSGDKNAEAKVTLTITKEGDVVWDVKKSISVTAYGDIDISTTDGSLNVSSGKDVSLSASGSLSADFAQDAKISTSGSLLMSGDQGATLDSPTICLGRGASNPVVKGTELMQFLGQLIATLSAYPPTAGVGSLTPLIPNIVSTQSFLSR
jgi:hypothetical protein